MASTEATTRMNHGQATPESTPGPDNKERQKAQAAPNSHGLATPEATPEPEERRNEADKAGQQQEENASANSKEAPPAQSKPPSNAESASQSQEGTQSQTQPKRKRLSSQNGDQGASTESAMTVERVKRKEAKTRKMKTKAKGQEANAVASRSQGEETPPGENVSQQTAGSWNTGAFKTQNESRASTITETKSWKPGLTRKNEPMLGYRTIGDDDKGDSRDHQFLAQAEIKKKSQYNLQFGIEIERRAADGYLQMNESKKNRLGDIDKKYSRNDAKDYREIKFIVSKPI